MLGPKKDHNMKLLRNSGKNCEKKEPALSLPCVRGEDKVEMGLVPFCLSLYQEN